MTESQGKSVAKFCEVTDTLSLLGKDTFRMLEHSHNYLHGR